MTDPILLVLIALFVKHFLADFPLQIPYHYKNKGTYLHPGGIFHAMIHGAGTFLALAWLVDFKLAAIMAVIDFVIHYHVDWAKVKLNTKYAWDPATHEKFWWLLGFDQLLHALTYIAFVGYLI